MTSPPLLSHHHHAVGLSSPLSVISCTAITITAVVMDALPLALLSGSKKRSFKVVFALGHFLCVIVLCLVSFKRHAAHRRLSEGGGGVRGV